MTTNNISLPRPSFHAYDVSLLLVVELRRLVPVMARHDPDLARQVKRAASSISLNLREGLERIGRDRIQHWRVAFGSAREVQAGLDIATLAGDLDEAAAAKAREYLDRVCAMLYRMTR